MVTVRRLFRSRESWERIVLPRSIGLPTPITVRFGGRHTVASRFGMLVDAARQHRDLVAECIFAVWMSEDRQ